MDFNAKNTLLSSLMVLFFTIGHAQITVEKVVLEAGEEGAKIPRLTDQANANNPIVEKINLFILDRFMLESFNADEIEDLRWSGLDFESDIQDDIFFFFFGGEYYGAYPNYVMESLFFDLKTGEQLSYQTIPFQALFTPYGYLNFLNRYWLKDVKAQFEEAIECSETEPYCSYYDITYQLRNNQLVASLVEDCYPRVIRACAPGYSVQVPFDSIRNYLSPLAKEHIFTESYPKQMGIDQYLKHQELYPKISENMYLFGKIDGKYAFSMALEFSKSKGEITGYYYYDRKQQKISLKGEEGDHVINLIETVDGQKTGSFLLDWNGGYADDRFVIYTNEGSYHLKGSWSSPDGSRKLPIVFTEVKFNDIN